MYSIVISRLQLDSDVICLIQCQTASLVHQWSLITDPSKLQALDTFALKYQVQPLTRLLSLGTEQPFDRQSQHLGLVPHLEQKPQLRNLCPRQTGTGLILVQKNQKKIPHLLHSLEKVNLK